MLAPNTLAPNRFEHAPLAVFASSLEASRAVAREVAALIRTRQREGRPAVLGLATGSTPVSFYAELVRLHREERLSFANVITFNLDEYRGLAPDHPQSYHHFMRVHLFDHVDVPAANIHRLDGTVAGAAVDAHCREYEEKIRAAGGIDFQILGIGRTGHIGFNEPGSARRSRTRLVTLDPLTRRDAAGDFGGEEHTPRYAITMGVRTILEARRIVLMAWGQHKAGIVRAAIEGEITPQVPASFLQEHDQVHFVLDQAAAGALGALPDALAGRCARGSGPRLGRTHDSPRHPLAVANAQEADPQADGRRLQRVRPPGSAPGPRLRLRGQPGGLLPDAAHDHRLAGRARSRSAPSPATRRCARCARPRPACFPKRVLVLSPHPDDDVISMGGTLCRLVEHGHEVHVAYQVSGANAVSDESLWRALLFVRDCGLADSGVGRAAASALRRLRGGRRPAGLRGGDRAGRPWSAATRRSRPPASAACPRAPAFP